MEQNLTFSYDFEITKESLKTVLINIENGTYKLGQATSYFVKMGLSSLTLLENAFKTIDFNFDKQIIMFLDKLLPQIKQTAQKDYEVYCLLIGAYFAWCAVKCYGAYFATFNDAFCLILNNKAYSPKHLVEYAIENNKNLTDLFNEFEN